MLLDAAAAVRRSAAAADESHELVVDDFVERVGPTTGSVERSQRDDDVVGVIVSVDAGCSEQC